MINVDMFDDLESFIDDAAWRFNAYKRLYDLGITYDYGHIAKLLGIKSLSHLTDRDRRVLKMLAGADALVIYKILLLRMK